MNSGSQTNILRSRKCPLSFYFSLLKKNSSPVILFRAFKPEIRLPRRIRISMYGRLSVQFVPMFISGESNEEEWGI
jgi:hypothetical protein